MNFQWWSALDNRQPERGQKAGSQGWENEVSCYSCMGSSWPQGWGHSHPKPRHPRRTVEDIVLGLLLSPAGVHKTLIIGNQKWLSNPFLMWLRPVILYYQLTNALLRLKWFYSAYFPLLRKITVLPLSK